VKPVLALLREMQVKGLAHITGGGLTENVPRVLRDDLTARIDRNAWPLPPLFEWLREHGNVADDEMFRVFNCGIGMVLVVSAGDADRATQRLEAQGEKVHRIGVIDRRQGTEPQTIVS
jgi:phosphoribosylformylglycinamidine cyclo-ligase